MQIRQQKFWLRLERASTGSWLEAVVNVLLPRENHPQYREKLYAMLCGLVKGYWPEWELVTYMEKEAHDEEVKREVERGSND